MIWFFIPKINYTIQNAVLSYHLYRNGVKDTRVKNCQWHIKTKKVKEMQNHMNVIKAVLHF